VPKTPAIKTSNLQMVLGLQHSLLSATYNAVLQLIRDVRLQM